jgi:hypothetical protein
VAQRALASINSFLPSLGLRLNPQDRAAAHQPRHRLRGPVIKPWRRTTRPRTLQQSLTRLETMPPGDVFASGNSYLARQAGASHNEQALICRALLKRGHAVEGCTYQEPSESEVPNELFTPPRRRR